MTTTSIEKLIIGLLLVVIAFVGIQKLTPLISDRLERAAKVQTIARRAK